MKTKYHSYKLGALPKGCQLCVQGRKSVLFVTGLCSAHCYFCPISDRKKNKDVVYINEWPTKKIRDIITEIELCDSSGVGITGGDPLERLTRTCSFIRALKKRFGKKFHIHLYTPLNQVTQSKLRRLYKAGLDEIRFHPNLDNKKLWPRMSWGIALGWDMGVEIPAIPGKEEKTKQLIDYIRDKVDFLNINELEYSDTNAKGLYSKGYRVKNSGSYAIKDSQEFALRMLRYGKGKVDNIHYCTAKLKDKVQLAERIMRRAHNVKRHFDILTDDGTLIRGAIYLKGLKPGIGYRKKLDKANKRQILGRLRRIRDEIVEDFGIPKKHIEVDERFLRIITNAGIIEGIAESVNESLIKECLTSSKIRCGEELFLAITEEYPTWDGFLVSVDFV